MSIIIKAFGITSEILNADLISVSHLRTTRDIKGYLEATYPKLKGIKYQMAVNHTLIESDIDVEDGSEVALLPPFSGG